VLAGDTDCEATPLSGSRWTPTATSPSGWTATPLRSWPASSPARRWAPGWHRTVVTTVT